MRNLSIGVAIVMILLGAVWFLQGIGILPGSFMTGQASWAIIGAILIIGGLALGYFGLRRKPMNPNS